MSRILIIEDDVIVQEFIKDILESAGYEVDQAADGLAGIQQYRQHPCELVVTDIFMPEKDGFEVILELKRDFPKIPIIAISDGGKYFYNKREADIGHILTAAKGLGANEAFRKPINIRQFLAAIQVLLPVQGVNVCRNSSFDTRTR